MKTFRCTDEELKYLSSRDARLAAFIRKYNAEERRLHDDFFAGLCYNIVDQQLSTKACLTLRAKLAERFGEITPETVGNAEELRACGLSQNKADCIAACAALFRSGALSAEKAAGMTDKELTDALTQVRGIGVWTAEMTLIFCLGRRDVLSISDYGIRKGISLLHGIDMKDKRTMEKFRELYSPCGTAASVCLWQIARMSAVEITEMISC